MACEIYAQLDRELKSTREERAQFAYRENEALRGISDRESKQIVKAANEKISQLIEQMNWHRQECKACKR